jgi:hypothetical protein
MKEIRVKVKSYVCVKSLSLPGKETFGTGVKKGVYKVLEQFLTSRIF